MGCCGIISGIYSDIFSDIFQREHMPIIVFLCIQTCVLTCMLTVFLTPIPTLLSNLPQIYCSVDIFSRINHSSFRADPFSDIYVWQLLRAYIPTMTLTFIPASSGIYRADIHLHSSLAEFRQDSVHCNNFVETDFERCLASQSSQDVYRNYIDAAFDRFCELVFWRMTQSR